MAITRSHPFNQRAETPATPKKASFHALLNRVRDRPGAVISKQLRVNQGARKRARGPGAQLQAELESAVFGIVPAKDSKGKLRFLFVPYPDVRDIAEETHLAIDASNTSDRFLARYPMYSAENMSTIQQELGKGFASHGMTSTKPYYEIPILHQGVVTMQHLSHSFNRDVMFKSWEWLQAQLMMVAARPRSASVKLLARSPLKPPSHQRRAQQHPLFSDPKTSCIIFLHWTIDPGPPTAAIYTAIATIQSTRPHHLFRAFPSQSELTHETAKLPDIHALNAIACTSPQKYAYRPRTCLTHGERKHDPTRCPLRGQRQIIMKRTHSCGGEHVQLIDGDSALPRHEPSTNPAIPHRWFGQAYEPFFSRFGEFRVFIAARPSLSPTTALRGRKGRILHTVVTEWVCAHDPGAMYARAATPQDFTDASVRPLTATDLHDFALYIYDALRSRGDWREHYESLEMGVRLDVGVASKRTLRKEGGKRVRVKGEEKRFFVNEITRFYGADYFSQHTLGAPQQEVCWAFAEAVDGYFGVEKGEVKEEV